VLLSGTVISGRVLPLPLLGAAPVIARVLLLCWDAVRGAFGRRRWLAIVPLGLFGLMHLVVSPLLRVMLTLTWDTFADREQQVAEQADLGPCKDGGVLYLLTGSDPFLSLYLTPALLFHTPDKARAERLRVLSMAPQDVRLTRVGSRSFELDVLGTPRRSNDFERLYRATPLEPGQSFRAEELRARVVATSEGLADVVHFDVDTPLDAPAVCFIAWRDGRVRPVKVPSVGQSVTVPHQPGPVGL
jgi:hypothetical protein